MPVNKGFIGLSVKREVDLNISEHFSGGFVIL